MLSYGSNLQIAQFVLNNAKTFAATAEKPITKFVSDFSKAYFKAKTTSLRDLRDLGEAVGWDSLKVIADKLTPADALSVLKRIDPANAIKATDEPNWMRRRLADLLVGAAEPDPVVKPTRTPRAASAPKKKRSVMAETDAFSAKPKRRVADG